jgi:hypothetical protein
MENAGAVELPRRVERSPSAFYKATCPSALPIRFRHLVI